MSKVICRLLPALLMLSGLLFVMAGSGCQPVAAAPEADAHGAGETGKHNEGAHPEAEGTEAHNESVTLTSEQMEKNQILVEQAGPGDLAVPLALTGEVKLNADRVAHVAPRIPGVVREVFKSLGDSVKAGEVMAVLDSRDLADLKADCLAARERESLCLSTFDREKGLWEKQISAEQDYLAARNALAESRIATRTAEQKLHAIGLTEDDLAKLSGESHTSLTRYEILAPFDSTIIDKHITLGETLKDDATAFTVADLGTVWVDLNVYQKDLANIQKGQEVVIASGDSPEGGVRVAVSYIGPIMGEETRTATVRLVLDNTQGQWRPGQFVTGFASMTPVRVAVMIPKTAIQTYEGKPSVFVREGDRFVATPIVPGRSNETHTEVLEGLPPGQAYAANGAFLLKATLEKSAVGHAH